MSLVELFNRRELNAVDDGIDEVLEVLDSDCATSDIVCSSY